MSEVQTDVKDATSNTTKEITVTVLDSSDDYLKYDPNNIRVHGERNKKTIKNSLEDLGPLRSGFCNEDGVILGGNGTLEQVRALGKKVMIVDGDEDTYVVVRRAGLSESEQIRAALLDNAASDQSTNDDKAIKRLADREDGQMLLEGVFTQKELGKLLKPESAAPATAPATATATGTKTRNVKSGAVGNITLVFTSEAKADFVERIKKLSDYLATSERPLSNITDTIQAVVEKALGEWLPPELLSEEPAQL